MAVALTDEHLQQLQRAKNLLENPGIAAKMTNLIGAPIEKGFELLPDNWSKTIGSVTETALTKATDAAIMTMKDVSDEAPSNRWHKLGVAVSGGVGGFFGFAALAVELPISTTLMLRSIADIARSHGESLADFNTRKACLEVFAMGGKSKHDDGAESGYFAVRAALARTVTETAEQLAAKGLAEEGSTLLLRFITKVAERFSLQVTEKVAAQAIPAIGAAGGALINTLFIDHFQDMAEGHFTVRKLERTYGKELIEQVYKTLP